jgi:hypothetical protein
MNVNAENQVEWDALCAVREHLSSATTTNRYQSNKDFAQFAKSGWPHLHAMDLLIGPTTRGDHAYHGTQAAASTSTGLSSPSTPFDIPGPASSSSHPIKHKLSSYDISAQSSASSKRKKASGLMEYSQLEGMISILKDAVSDIKAAQAPRAPAPAPASAPALAPAPPAPAPAPTPELSPAETLIRSVRRTEPGWLSEDEVIAMTDLFRVDPSIGQDYLYYTKQATESMTRKWVQKQLEKVKIHL